jgi:hypothetical protein
MIQNGFYYCKVNNAIYHKTDEGMDILVGYIGDEFLPWTECYTLGLAPITKKEISVGEMVFLGE